MERIADESGLGYVSCFVHRNILCNNKFLTIIPKSRAEGLTAFPGRGLKQFVQRADLLTGYVFIAASLDGFIARKGGAPTGLEHIETGAFASGVALSYCRGKQPPA
jgi:hypothetical protein